MPASLSFCRNKLTSPVIITMNITKILDLSIPLSGSAGMQAME